MRLWFTLIAGLIWIGLSTSASAHTRSQSFSSWEIKGAQAEFSFAVDARRITQLASLYPETDKLPELLSLHLGETISAVQDDQPCALRLGGVSGTLQGVFRVNGSVSCSQAIEAQAVTVQVAAFFKVSPTHIHVAHLA